MSCDKGGLRISRISIIRSKPWLLYDSSEWIHGENCSLKEYYLIFLLKKYLKDCHCLRHWLAVLSNDAPSVRQQQRQTIWNHPGSVSLYCMILMSWANPLVIQSISAVSETEEAVSPLNIQEWRGLFCPLSLNTSSYVLLHEQLLETNVEYPQGSHPLYTLCHR